MALPLEVLNSGVMVGVLRVSGDGLQAVAAHCAAVAEALLVAAPVPCVGLPVQATSGAVGAAGAAVGGVVTVLAGRVQTRGVNAVQSGAGFVVTDDTGARDIAAVGASIEKA